MYENLLELDYKLFSYLYKLGSEPFDAFWLLITKQIAWTPLFLLLFYIIKKKVTWKQMGIFILFLAVLLTCTDQITNLFKNSFERLRPCNNAEFDYFLRDITSRKSFSFFSGHASNSMASTVFVIHFLRKHYRYTYLLFLFPMIFAYSRIYLGLHYPSDILAGYIFGSLMGTLFAFLYSKYNTV